VNEWTWQANFHAPRFPGGNEYYSRFFSKQSGLVVGLGCAAFYSCHLHDSGWNADAHDFT
jgi:hypothetical protein